MRKIPEIWRGLVFVYWKDAQTRLGTTLESVKNEGLAIKKTKGTVCYDGFADGDEVIIVNTEEDVGDCSGDFTIIPKDWVLEITPQDRDEEYTGGVK